MGPTRLSINGIDIVGGRSIVIKNGQVFVDGKEAEIAPIKGIVEVRVIDGSIGELHSDASVNCEAVTGNVTAGGSVNCGDVGGSVKAGGSVNCDSVRGDVSSGGSVNCDDIGGNITATTVIRG